MRGLVRISAITALLVPVMGTSLALARYEMTHLVASDANANDRFGISTAIDGNIAVVGAFQNDVNTPGCGAAYIYELSGSQWLQRQKLTPFDGSPGDNFGRSVAVESNTIVVGSYYADNAEPNTGAAYVFTRSGALWTQQQKLFASDANAEDRFGVSVSVKDNLIVVGAYGDDGQAGSAYVFTRAGSVWSEQLKLTASDRAQDDLFGNAVATDGNVIFVGAYKKDDTGSVYVKDDAGSVYVFDRQGTTWVEGDILHASDSNQWDHFGCSVALDGNLAAIGAYECDINGFSDTGAAYVFTKTGSAWVEQQKLADTIDPNGSEDFGRAVAVANGSIFAGCVNDSVNGEKTGSVFEFVRAGDAWVQHDRLTAAEGGQGDEFGCSVSACGQHLIVGASCADVNGANSGSAYIFAALPGDIDGDGGVDFADFALLATAWRAADGQPRWNPACDISDPPDGVVNIHDLETLCNDWLAGK
jgi:hypothetical protein